MAKELKDGWTNPNYRNALLLKNIFKNLSLVIFVGWVIIYIYTILSLLLLTKGQNIYRIVIHMCTHNPLSELEAEKIAYHSKLAETG